MDTDATLSLIDPEMVPGGVVLQPFDLQLKAVCSQELKVLGEVTLQVVLGAWESKHKFVVTSSLTVGPLLGPDFLSEHGVRSRGPRRQEDKLDILYENCTTATFYTRNIQLRLASCPDGWIFERNSSS